jgi:hypothetical protein
VSEVAKHFFIPMVHSPLGAVGYVAAPKPTSTGRRGLELRNMWQRWSSPLGEAEPGAMGHMAALKLTSTGRQGLELRNT